MQDITSYIKTDEALPSTQILLVPINTSSYDIRRYCSGAMIISVGAHVFTAANTLEVKLQESDDDVTFTDVPSQFVTEAFRKDLNGVKDTTGKLFLNAADQGSKTYMLGYTGKKRYFRAQMVGAAATDVLVQVTNILANPKNVPTDIQYYGVV